MIGSWTDTLGMSLVCNSGVSCIGGSTERGQRNGIASRRVRHPHRHTHKRTRRISASLTRGTEGVGRVVEEGGGRTLGLAEGVELLLLVPDARASVSDDANALWPLTLAHPNFYRAPSSARVDSALIQILPHVY